MQFYGKWRYETAVPVINRDEKWSDFAKKKKTCRKGKKKDGMESKPRTTIIKINYMYDCVWNHHMLQKKVFRIRSKFSKHAIIVK